MGGDIYNSQWRPVDRPVICQRCFPSLLRIGKFRRLCVECPARGGDQSFETRELSRLAFIRNRHPRLALAHARLAHVREKRSHRVEVFGRVGVELVIVAFAATHRAGHPDTGEIAHAIGVVLR